MFVRSKSTCLIVAGLAMMFAFHTAVAGGATLYVGSGETYTTIQGAVDDAEAYDLIIVRDGTYVENVVVDNYEVVGESSSGLHLRDGLSIESENGPDTTTVEGADPNLSVFLLSACEITLSGFTITGATDPMGDGVLLVDATQCHVLGNDFIGDYRGVRANLSTENVISGNEISGCTGPAIILANTNTYNIVSGNNIHDIAQAGISLIVHSDYNEIINNTITASERGGIHLTDDSHHNIVSGNAVTNCAYDGLYFNKSDFNTITHNTCTGNHTGINMNYSADDNVVYLNNFTGNTFANATTSDFASSTWYSLEDLTYEYDTGRFTGRLGNHWGDYAGADDDGDGVGEDPHDVYTLGSSQQDLYPLIESADHYDVLAPPAVHNVATDEWFYTIQEAIDDDDTLDGQLIQIGPGEYEENIDVTKQLVLQAYGAPRDTIVRAADPDDHAFDVTADYVAIIGFGIFGATGADVAGIHITDGVEHCSISDVASSGNTYAFLGESGTENAVSRLQLASYATSVSFLYEGGVGIREVATAPPPRADQVSMGRYVEVVEIAAPAELQLWVNYEDSDPGEFNESSLRMWRWDGTEWWEVVGSGADPDINRVAASGIVEFGIFAPMGVEQHGAIWTGASGSPWNESLNWTTLSWPNNTSKQHYSVFIDSGNVGDVTVVLENGLTAAIDNLTVDPGDKVQIGVNGGAALRIDSGPGMGVVANNGTIELASPHFGTYFQINGDVTLGGIGEVILRPQGPNYMRGLTPTDRLTNGAAHTIRGSRRVGDNYMALTNQGAIDADDPAYPLEVNPTDTEIVYNTGTMQASAGGTLQLLGGTFDNTDGLIRGMDGSVAQITTGAVVSNGETTTVGDGVVELRDSAVACDITNTGTLRVPNGGGTGFVRGTITNQGTIELTSVHYSTALSIDGDVTFEGDGDIVLGPSGPNYVRGATATDRLTNAANHTIRGSRELGKNRMTLTNEGTIDADNPAYPLTIDMTDGESNYNTGTMRASNGATLQITSGTYDNTNGQIEAADSSTAQISTGALVSGGRLVTDGSGNIELRAGGVIADLTNDGAILLPNDAGGGGYAQGTIINQGTIELTSLGNGVNLYMNGDVTLSGTGEVVLGPSGPNALRGATATDRLTNAANHTIRGSRELGKNLMTLTNEGTIDADNPAYPLIINTTDGETNYNTGIMQGSSGGTLQVTSGAYDNTGGLIRALAGSIASLRSASVRGGALDTTDDGVIQLASNSLISDLTNLGTLMVPNGQGPGYVSGTITNLGTFEVQGGGSGTNLLLAGDTVLTGTGVFSIGGHNDIDNAYNLTNSAGHTMRILGNNDIRSFLINEGALEVPTGKTLLLTREYTPSSGSVTEVDGTITAPGVTSLSGTLTGDGTFSGSVSNVEGTVAPGSETGSLHIQGTYIQDADGTLVIELGGLVQGDSYDLLTVSSTARLGGKLRIVLTDGFVPAIGDSFTILTAGAVDGKFDEIQSAGQYTVTYDSGSVTITVGQMSGDWNGDDVVDLDDYLVFSDCMAGPNADPTPSLPGVTADDCLNAFDFGVDGDVDSADFAVLQSAME